MTGTIFDIKHFAVHDGPGIRTTVFLKGCPLQCWWCHNPEGISSKPEQFNKEIVLDGKSFQRKERIGYEISVEKLMDEILKDKAFYLQSGGGVTFSGGEPLVKAEFLLHVLKQCKAENLHTVIDTSGFAKSKIFESLIPFTDLFLFDLKILDPDEHKKYTGVTNQLILSNLDFLIEKRAKIIIRFPIVPGVNDTEDNLEAMKVFLQKRKEIKEIHLLPFHNMAERKYTRCGIPNMSQELIVNREADLDNIQAIFEEILLKVKVGG